MPGDGNAKQGNKGSHHSYQHRMLLSLGEIIAASTGGATEATLISVLNAIVASDQDIEILLVRDEGDSDVVVQQITNYQTGTPVVSYKKVDGTTHTVIGPLVYLDPSAVMNLILTELQVTTAQKTPTHYVGTGTHNVPIGATEISIFNNGTGDATVNATIIPAGVTRTFGFKNPIAVAIACDGVGSEQLIIDYMI